MYAAPRSARASVAAHCPSAEAERDRREATAQKAVYARAQPSPRLAAGQVAQAIADRSSGSAWLGSTPRSVRGARLALASDMPECDAHPGNALHQGAQRAHTFAHRSAEVTGLQTDRACARGWRCVMPIPMVHASKATRLPRSHVTRPNADRPEPAPPWQLVALLVGQARRRHRGR